MTRDQWSKLPWDDLRFPRAVLSPQRAGYVLRAHGLKRLPLPGYVLDLGQGRAMENVGGTYRVYDTGMDPSFHGVNEVSL